MERQAQTDALTTSFPWGRLEKDGTFNFDIARGRFGVLGAKGHGYWSHRGGPLPDPHSHKGLASAVKDNGFVSAFSILFGSFDHLDGADLRQNQHLTDEQGWRLDPNLIPHLNFPSADKRPILVTEFAPVIKDWDSWYLWRGLSKESPAALLMTSPMSVYWMLVHCLEVTKPDAGSPASRKLLTVHLLAADVELNYLPLFGELALLLPHHDIRLTIFGSGVYTLMEKAKAKPDSVAGRSSLSSPVFEYRAPPECGSGKISIHLYGESRVWSLEADGGAPDALVACNAGLTSYKEWIPVVVTAHQHDIPFAITEYSELSAEMDRDNMPKMLGRATPRPRDGYQIEMSPFQRPGQRPQPSHRLPNLQNGFTLVVVKRCS